MWRFRALKLSNLENFRTLEASNLTMGTKWCEGISWDGIRFVLYNLILNYYIYQPGHMICHQNPQNVWRQWLRRKIVSVNNISLCDFSSSPFLYHHITFCVNIHLYYASHQADITKALCQVSRAPLKVSTTIIQEKFKLNWRESYNKIKNSLIIGQQFYALM